MTAQDILNMKADYTKRNIEYWISELIKKQDSLLFLQNRLDTLSKMKKLSEDEKKIKEKELPASIETAKFDIEKAEVHIVGLQKLLVSYEETKPLKS
jgi:hypothetical protein